MKSCVLVIVLCFAAIGLFSQPKDSPAKNETPATQSTPTAVPPNSDHKSADGAEATKSGPPHWYTSSEWWLVIIAALTGFAIAYQAREMVKTTEIIGKQAELMKSQTDILVEYNKATRDSADATAKSAAATEITVGEMQKQAAEMEKQTSHLEASVAVAKTSADIAARNDRPWVGLAKPIVLSKIIERPRPMIEITTTIKNFGTSPAFNVIPCVDFVIGNRGTDIRPEIETSCARIEENILPLKVGDMLFPGDTFSFPTEVRQPLGDGQTDPIYFFPGCIIYLDIAGKVHHTKICQWTDREHLKEGANLSSCSRQSAD